MSSTASTPVNDTASAVSTIFNKSNIVLLLWFLAIYVIASFLIGIFRKSDPDTSTMARFVDIFAFVIILVFMFYYFFSYSDKQKQDSLSSGISWLRDYLSNGFSIVSILFFILLFYTVIYFIQVPMGANNKPVIVGFVEMVAWGLFMLVLIVDVFQYMFQISLVHLFFDNGLGSLWNSLPNTPPIILDASGNRVIVDTSGNPVSTPTSKPSESSEVFNISNNLYTYEDAQAICAAYGATLATYDQIEEAYNQGAEWCNYGWSANQMAFFPTQKSTWTALQSKTGHENDCGRPGINGGYMANPQIQFGVNCYGKKPQPSDDDKATMKAKLDPIPLSADEVVEQEKIAYWQQNAAKFLQLNSFNKTKWSEY